MKNVLDLAHLRIAFVALFLAAASPSLLAADWVWRNPRPQGNTIRAAAVLSSREAVAVGVSGIILKTDDSGASWKQQRVGATLNAIAVRGGSLIAVGGDAGYVRNARVIVRSTDRGNTWKTELDEWGPVLYGVSVGEDLTAYACGEAGALLSRAAATPVGPEPAARSSTCWPSSYRCATT